MYTAILRIDLYPAKVSHIPSIENAKDDKKVPQFNAKGNLAVNHAIQSHNPQII